MGGSAYNFSARSARTEVYKKQSITDNFEQNKIGKMHESMDPKKALLREARDSANHPNSLPIILGLDVTGSMGHIPQHMIQDGLPSMIAKLHEKGIADPAVLFMGVGDSRCDRYPLQVGQFESGDAELDMWLTRTYLEGGGGGNGGESYAWPWYFAAERCKTDHFEKRGKRGFIFTVGDDDCHDISTAEFQEVLGVTQEGMKAEELFQLARKQWHVYHFCLNRGSGCNWWKSFMGEHALSVNDYREIPDLIANLVSKHSDGAGQPVASSTPAAQAGDVKITL